MNKFFAGLAVAAVLSASTNSADAQQTKLLWGDTHLHTNLSADAYLNKNTTADLDSAYNFAKGLPVIDDLSRAKIRIETPLDFLAVTDHAEYAGLNVMLFNNDPLVAGSASGARFIKMINGGKGLEMFKELIATVNTNKPIKELNTDPIRRSIWDETVDAAERHNDPGKFSALIGWEWSSLPNGQNLHRIVFMPEGAEVAKKFIPFSAFDSDVETDFWTWLDKTSKKTGASFVAIPHNGNISGGLMFPQANRAGKPINAAYANLRMRWEPVIETTQIKGDSETHPGVSPDDEFADFETYEHLIKSGEGESVNISDSRAGSYTRPGLKRGLEIENKIGANPFKYGLIGATDSHTAYSTAEESNFWGKFSLDAIPENKKDKEVVPGAFGWDMSASGLAGVWATENTRAAITAAFKRREVYGTSGPRIALRVFGGWDYMTADAGEIDIAAVGYATGIPMGGDLTEAPGGKAPKFLIHAVKDPKDANLDRIQMVKGWLGADGKAREKVYDVAWSAGRELGADGRLARVGNTVDLSTSLYTNTIGSTQLSTVWTDPDFDANQRAFYYVRVLQIPTPRNSTYDAIALGIDPKMIGKAVTIQERAYSSPIWYTP